MLVKFLDYGIGNYKQKNKIVSELNNIISFMHKTNMKFLKDVVKLIKDSFDFFFYKSVIDHYPGDHYYFVFMLLKPANVNI